MRVHFGHEVNYWDGEACVARHVEPNQYDRRGGCALFVDQLWVAPHLRGRGHMTRILRRYLRRLPHDIKVVFTAAHPYRCEDALPIADVLRYARWLRRLGFRFCDRRAFFDRLRAVRAEGGDAVTYWAVMGPDGDGWMVLER